MAAVSKVFPHETEEIFKLLCEAMKGVADLGSHIDGLPGDVGVTLENVLASAFSDVCNVLASEQGDMLVFAIRDVDMAAGLLEAVRVFGRLDEGVYFGLRELLLRAHDLLERMWKEELHNGKVCELIEEDRPS